MAEAVYGTFVGKVVENLVDALKDQANYLCCHRCNVTSLADEIRELNCKYSSVKERVRAATDNLGNITTEVISWLEKVEELQRKSDRIRDADEEVRRNCLCKWCPVLHYSLSRDAANATKVAIKLQMNTPTSPISYPRRPAEIDPIPATSETRIKSRDSMEGEIMNAIKDEKVYLIGLCGMGGVGKTTIAKKIEKRVREQKSMFEHVVFAIVSQPPNLPKIQDQIGEALGLKLSGESVEYRARILHERLIAEKGILIILDDVWERLNLEELGIPSQKTHARCKLILTSRNEEVFKLTGNPVSKIFQLEVLNDEESWTLFRDNAGSAIDSPDLIQIAKDIARECKGLPLALKTVGCALRDSGKSSWENALVELQKSTPMNVPGVVKDVYQPLMFSVKQLESEEARSLFLLCCLFPEDYTISLEELVSRGLGLRIFEGLENLTVARNRVETILKTLISRSLLIESNNMWENQLHVKMHDVVRDMGIWISSMKKIESEGRIASKEKHVFKVSHGKDEWPMAEEESYGNYTCISLLFSRKDVIPEFMDCPRLVFLWMGLINSSGGIYFDIPEKFFSRMTSLRVLVASEFGSLPPSVGLLNNLRTLHLSYCQMSETTSVIGKLVNLEILRLEDCKVDVLPKEIGGLKKLKQLDISHCRELRVEFGVISGLVRLEELVILGSFDNWEDETNGTSNARLSELDRLDHLTTLRIKVRNPSVIPTQKPRWVQRVTKYSIAVPSFRDWNSKRFYKAITLTDPIGTPLGDWLYDMASDAEYLNVVGPSCPIVVKRLAPYSRDLKYLVLCDFTDVQYLVWGQQNGAIFPMLMSLLIHGSDSLQEISNVPPPAGSFAALEEIELGKLSGLTCLWKFPSENLYLSNLKSVQLDDCGKLAYLFSLSIAQSLTRLETLRVSTCQNMEEIFKKEDGETEIKKLEFPKLDTLSLRSMKSLRCLCNGVDAIEVPALRSLKLVNLPSIIAVGDPDIHQRGLFEQLFAGNFSGLQILRLERINHIKCLFSPSILRGFSKLEELIVEDCSELEEIIERDEIVGEAIVFPKLRELDLFKLPKILYFCYIGVEFPLLEKLNIWRCPLMERFSQGLCDASNSRFSLCFFHKEFAGNFSGLQILRLERMNHIKCLFSPSILRGFSKLEELIVEHCSELEEIIERDEIVGEAIVFPKLRKLDLFELPKILYFCYIGVEFPLLEKLNIWFCPLMERFSQGLCDASNSRFSLCFFHKEDQCPKLKSLKLTRQPNIARIFDLPTFRALTNLEELVLEDCEELQEVIANEEVEGLTNIEEILSSQLNVLELFRLPKIRRFSPMKRCLEFPSLKRAKFINCPMLERFSFGPLHLPNIKRIYGLPSAEFANKFFFNKEISSRPIHPENNCFTISATEISINFAASYPGGTLEWFIEPDSSESFVDAVNLGWFESAEVVGNFETAKLATEVVYETTIVIMLGESPLPLRGDEPVELQITKPGGITQKCTKILDELPREEWIEISLGKFTRESHQSGQLEFVLRVHGDMISLSVKGFRIRKA